MGSTLARYVAQTARLAPFFLSFANHVVKKNPFLCRQFYDDAKPVNDDALKRPSSKRTPRVKKPRKHATKRSLEVGVLRRTSTCRLNCVPQTDADEKPEETSKSSKHRKQSKKHGKKSGHDDKKSDKKRKKKRKGDEDSVKV